ncbi:MAG: DUF4194 domain-containing protein, partial [Saprospiraceae bacterium]|nr:DUF4194 domain-containing protein [Saprospiraceae bacterium]
MDTPQPNIAPYARSAVKLLQGPISDDQSDLWIEIIRYQIELSQYFEKIALEVVIDKRDGYAYLKQMPIDESGTTLGLVRRMPLSYDLSIVCVLLREWLLEFEAGDLETANLYITPREFRNRIDLFFKEKANEMKFIRELNRHLDECVRMGFLKLVHKTSSSPD